MRNLRAWRLYLGMPLYGNRKPEGGSEEIMRRGAEDAVRLVYQPSIGGAVAEVSGAVDEVRARLAIAAELPIGIFGFSQGGAAALLAVAQSKLPFKAAVTFGAVVDLPTLVDAIAAFYGTIYEWTDERRSVAEELSAGRRAHALAESGAAMLLAVGEQDSYPIREPTERLVAAVSAAGGTAEMRIMPDLAHAFVEEPGEAPAPQGPQARAVDLLATEWFRSHLR
jgi:dipeptidyl aminopeptidase/acylaminoacyl peptidase